VVVQQVKVVLSSAWEALGEQFVMIYGIFLMPELCADSLATLLSMLFQGPMHSLALEQDRFCWTMFGVLALKHVLLTADTSPCTTVTMQKMLE
jgi:hypothetical protein